MNYDGAVKVAVKYIAGFLIIIVVFILLYGRLESGSQKKLSNICEINSIAVISNKIYEKNQYYNLKDIWEELVGVESFLCGRKKIIKDHKLINSWGNPFYFYAISNDTLILLSSPNGSAPPAGVLMENGETIYIFKAGDNR